MTGKLAIWQTAAQNEYGHFSARPHTKPPTGRSSRCATDMFFTEEEANAKSELKCSPRSMLGNVIRTKPATKPSAHTAMIRGIEVLSVLNGFSKSFLHSRLFTPYLGHAPWASLPSGFVVIVIDGVIRRFVNRAARAAGNEFVIVPARGFVRSGLVCDLQTQSVIFHALGLVHMERKNIVRAGGA